MGFGKTIKGERVDSIERKLEKTMEIQINCLINKDLIDFEHDLLEYSGQKENSTLNSTQVNSEQKTIALF